MPDATLPAKDDDDDEPLPVAAVVFEDDEDGDGVSDGNGGKLIDIVIQCAGDSCPKLTAELLAAVEQQN